ncbi:MULTISPECIES: Gfo/Idh/MocA family oxidoreductase [unclassified Sinorhizobium]|uniref:Gfo/Idh/MocA family protein n=1 Tax=unclassified Sinorhizobium TaxID=2613772 RepID=UPI0024C3A3FE|nr:MULTISPECIES: Gfo/Idh/MocA family oxidoreductase [unclassified Sinorhizobium]MDK1374411.1 Gfo/Idh/MocA family oxidoreductase [Sinorhizobium sp. 6-70]MDK1478936.1 Gfo/Idh/MocA family oxidoreductase [Sinorhizobium sp. 6-117]
MDELRFAAVGLNHNHIYGQVNCLLRAGARLVGFHETDDALAAEFSATYKDVPRIAKLDQILEDERIGLITSAAISAERAELAIRAMRHGKDVLVDKPGMTSLDQLAKVRRVQAETGRIFSILYSEHFESPATVRAGELVAAGAIGEVVHMVGLGPHRLRKESRPGWFFRRADYGGILTDIASHQCEQFLFFAGATDATILSASVDNRSVADSPELQDTGSIHLSTGRATGMIHVNWLTPDGMPTWGDGRLFIVGTTGTIEVRKTVDLAGREGGNHLFLADRNGVEHIDCSGVDLPFGRQLLADIRDRTETAMPRERCFNAMELALSAQAIAEHNQEKN